MQRLVVSARRLRASRLAASCSVAWPSSCSSSRALGGVRFIPSAKPLPSPSRMIVADLLEVSKQFRSKQTNYIHEDQTLDDAVKALTQNENSASLVVVNKEHQVVGLITNRMALKRVVRMRSTGKRTDWNMKVGRFYHGVDHSETQSARTRVS
jgi:hypothetical protein